MAAARPSPRTDVRDAPGRAVPEEHMAETPAAAPRVERQSSSLRELAVPTGPSITCTLTPRPARWSANRPAAGPEATIGVRSPRPGTGAIRATSTTSAPLPDAASASCRFRPGDEVFRSAQTVPARRAGRALVSARRASWALLTLSTSSASRTESASLLRGFTPSGGSTAGSKPRTSAPVASRSSASSDPASPKPRTATARAPATVNRPSVAAPACRACERSRSSSGPRPGLWPAPAGSS